ncbi:Putative formate dehydrogenase-specific chaperone [Campylobacter sputorum subsp. bubulus]|uniref:Formate dehydrogenase-specific chaperone n=1 Tax=Campylobacter sputorum subsp. sputorum TaxID=32024 RepID=A0A381DJX3_9BACT|nr:molecular chaperone TorD family protein [Campylobacter sputorum]ASM35844.1 putative formate dehydrogenase-specific chaperone [Campylobacter sputorum aubsp. sputorum RM3237]ASM37528.1 putative formate dehydrogenase-specific chaperone [Campylobacter sputorum bv. faecalis CCUG 20703]ASM39196.1 putative formate dehydrogenase-specific chaperone [Campylobacter sputorum bv. paraureolyticus LMG 11764]KAB0582420.1 molecular chaperone TorD family protein [Campylobacter sputorum subsp. sputorum]MDY612
MKDILKARSYYYEFASSTLFFSEKESLFKNMQEKIKELSKFPITDENKTDFEVMAKFDFSKFKDEQNAMFFSLSYSNVPTTASFYDEGRDNGKARLDVINIIKKSSYRRDEKKCEEGEDFIGFIFGLMATFLKDEANENKQELSSELFKTSINNFIDEFLDMLEKSKYAVFFKAYVSVMRNFISLERSLLEVQEPPKKVSQAEISLKKQSYMAEIINNED